MLAMHAGDVSVSQATLLTGSGGARVSAGGTSAKLLCAHPHPGQAHPGLGADGGGRAAQGAAHKGTMHRDGTVSS